MIEYLRDLVSKSKAGDKNGKFTPNLLSLYDIRFWQCLTASKFHVVGNYVLQFADDFAYTDPVSFNNTVHVFIFS